MLGDLSARYESNGDPGCISTGYNDPGGKSYGAYQLASRVGTLGRFVRWMQNHHDPIYRQYGNALAQHELASYGFDEVWTEIATNDGQRFLEQQHDFIKASHYDVAAEYLKEAYFDIEKHSETMKDVLWSRSVQYGPGDIVDMFTQALDYLPERYPNLSYVDDRRFDYDLIVGIYEVCKTPEWNSSALRESLNYRFETEKQEALAAFTEEVKSW